MSKKPHRKGIIVNLFNEQSGYCCYCNRPMTLRLNKPRTATVDHVQPVSKGGKSSLFNYVAACRPCNEKKSNTSLVMFLWANPNLAA